MFDYRKYTKEMGRQKLQQKDIRERTGLSQTALAMIFNGKQQPRPHTIQILAEALDMDYDEFYIEPREKHDVNWHYHQVLKAVAGLSNYDCSDPKRLEKLIAKHNSLVEGYSKLYGQCLPAEDITDEDYAV